MDSFDRLEIRDLIDRYSLGVTICDTSMIEAVFTDDAVWTVAAPFDVNVSGAKAIAAAIGGATCGMDVICQMVHSVVIDADGDGARTRCVVQEVGRARDGSSGMSMVGIYSDRLVRTVVGWRFVERSFQPHLLDDTVPKGVALG